MFAGFKFEEISYRSILYNKGFENQNFEVPLIYQRQAYKYYDCQ